MQTRQQDSPDAAACGMNRRLCLQGGAALAGALVLAACGGGGGGGDAAGSTSTPPPAETPLPDVSAPSANGGTTSQILAYLRTAGPVITDAPMIAPAPWAPGSPVSIGEWRSSAGNWYASIGDEAGAAGVTAASGTGPSGTGTASIVDGTVHWYYMGPAQLSQNDPLAPTITSVAVRPPSTNPQRIDYNSGKIGYAGGQPTPSASNTSYVFPALTIDNSPTSGNTGVGGANFGFKVGVMTESAVIAFAINLAVSVNVLINEFDGRGLRRIIAGGMLHPQANPGFLTIDFSSVGGRKWREVIVEVYRTPGLTNSFRGVYVSNSTDTVLPAPTLDKARLRAAFVGSSITGGANVGPTNAHLYWHQMVANRFGISDAWNQGSGGTGFLATNAGKSLNIHDRIAKDLARMPPVDVIFLEGLINDADDGLLQEGVASTMRLARATAGPKPIIVVLGAFPSATGPSAAMISKENKALAAFNEVADAASYFMPICTDPLGAWLTGTAYPGHAGVAGNSAQWIGSDGTHLNAFGHQAMAARVEQSFSTLIA